MTQAKDIKPTDQMHSDGTVTRNGVRYGCMCDVDPDENPEGCVIDDGAYGDCIYAILKGGRHRRSRWTCGEWVPVPDRSVAMQTTESEKAQIERLRIGSHRIVPVEIAETPIEDAWLKAHEEYERMVAAGVFPRPAKAMFVWDAMLKAAEETKA